MESKSIQNLWKHVSVAISEKVSKNVTEISICFALFQEADVLETWYILYQNDIFLKIHEKSVLVVAIKIET